MKNNHSTNRGSALMMAIVMTLLLFIIGTAFLMSARTDTQTVAAVDDLATSDNAVQAVIGQINAVLVQDLFGTDNLLLNNDAGDEPYDYPGDVDPWLADLEPMYLFTYSGTDYFGWRHITDLWGNDFDFPPDPANPAYYYDPDNDGNNDENRSSGVINYYYWIYNSANPLGYYKPTVAKIVSDNETTETIKDQDDSTAAPRTCLWGARADADGDGVADARWVPIPNITGPRGENCYTAVRIIDNCAMINVNTAFRNTERLATPEAWDGSQTTHVNLRGICKGTSLPADLDNAITALHDLRCGWSGVGAPPSPPVTATDYYFNVCRSPLNPDPSYNLTARPVLFDISDELDLRYRFFLDAMPRTRIENPWLQQTFLPGYPNTLQTPYDLPGDLPNWYKKASAKALPIILGEGFYTRRHIATTYSFDRVIAPEKDTSGMPAIMQSAWYNWTNWNHKTEPQSYRPVCINNVVATASMDPSAIIGRLAGAIWLGLDGSQLQKLPQFKNTIFEKWGNNKLRERIAWQLAVNLIDQFDSDDSSTHITVGSDRYHGFEYNETRLYINKVAVSYMDVSGAPVPHYAISIYSPKTIADPNGLIGWKVVVGKDAAFSSPYLLPALRSNTTVCIDEDNANGFVATPPSVVPMVTSGFNFKNEDYIVLLDPDDRPCDIVKVLDMTATPASAVTKEIHHSLDRKAYKKVGGSDPNALLVWDTAVNSGGTPWANAGTGLGALPTDPVAPAATTTVPIQLKNFNGMQKNIAEAYHTLLLGGMKVGDPNVTYVSAPTFWSELLKHNGNDISTPDKVHYGRVNAADPNFFGLPQYLTVFAPFIDTIDNDNDGFSDSFDANLDGFDNDGDGLADALDPEGNEKFWGELDELAVAGRININTAPWFVIKQLPWLGTWYDSTASAYVDNNHLAQAIVAYRDKLAIRDGDGFGADYDDYDASGAQWPDLNGRAHGINETSPPSGIRETLGFASINELMNVTQDRAANGTPSTYTYSYDVTNRSYDIRRYGWDNGSPVINDNPASDTNPKPFYAPFAEDDVENDLLERDILLHRVSNLATVRSDVFTAYIAVRIGEAGPIRRVMAIFDRSNVFSASDTPRLVALQPVADPD